MTTTPETPKAEELLLRAAETISKGCPASHPNGKFENDIINYHQAARDLAEHYLTHNSLSPSTAALIEAAKVPQMILDDVEMLEQYKPETTYDRGVLRLCKFIRTLSKCKAEKGAA